MRSKRARLLPVVAVLLLAAVVRVVDLDGQNLWIDETFSLWAAGEPLVEGAVKAAENDVHPPLYFVLLGFWTRPTGYSELSGRYFSAMAGVLAVAFTYALGRRLFERHAAHAAIWAALALAVMGMHVRYARELRMYALLALLSVASTHFYARWRESPTRWRAFVYWAVTAALPYTHYYGVLIPLVHTTHLLTTARRWRLWRDWALMQAGVWGAFAFWLPALETQAQLRPQGLHHANASDWPTVEWMLNMLADYAPELVGGLMVVGVVVSWGTAYRAPTSHRNMRDRIILVLAWLAVPVVGGFSLNLWIPNLTLRNLIGVAPAVALLVGLGIGRLPRLAQPIVAALLVYNALAVYPDLYPPNLRWRDFVQEIAAELRADDVLLYHLGPVPVSHPFEYYRRREPSFPVTPISLFDLPGPPSTEAFAQEVSDLVADEPRVWMITSYETPINWYTFATLRQTHSLSRRVNFYAANAYLFEPPPVPPEDAAYQLGYSFALTPTIRTAPPYYPGDVFEVALAWNVLETPEVDYSVGLHLVNKAFKLSAQADAYPDPRTSTWQRGEGYDTVHRLTLPDDLSPGRYDVHLVVYTWWDLRRLWVWDASAPLLLGDYILLDTLVVEEP